jgi:hypothetical protein
MCIQVVVLAAGKTSPDRLRCTSFNFAASSQAIVQFVVLTFPQYSFATTSSHLVIKLQMVFCADMLNFFFGQDESLMPGLPLFGFEPTVVYFPSHSAIISLLFP